MDLRDVAALFRSMYLALVDEGFTDEQAMSLTPAAVSHQVPARTATKLTAALKSTEVGRTGSAVSRAGEWLLGYLREHGPTSSTAVKTAAQEQAISSATLHRAREHAGVVVSRISSGKETTWSLPGDVSVSRDEPETETIPIVSTSQPETDDTNHETSPKRKPRIKRSRPPEMTARVEPDEPKQDAGTWPALEDITPIELEQMTLKDLRVYAKDVAGVDPADIRGADHDLVIEQILIQASEEDLNSVSF